MGLLYSITLTVYSYIYPNNETPTITQQKLNIFTKKLIYGLQQRLLSIKRDNYKLQLQFINRISKQTNNNNQKHHKLANNRDQFNQRILIDNMIMHAITCGVYEQLITCAKQINHQSPIIPTGLQKVSDECLSAIFAIVHLYNEFELKQFIQLKQFLPEPYPVIGVDKLNPSMRRYLKYKQPNDYERNLFVIEMCKRHKQKVSLEVLNQANHGFMGQMQLAEYHKSNKINKNWEQLNSDGLYARSAGHQVQDNSNNDSENKKQSQQKQHHHHKQQYHQKHYNNNKQQQQQYAREFAA